MSIELVIPSNHLILCRPLLSPSIFPSIRVFSNKSVLRIRWPNYWSFSQSPGVSANDKECSNYHTIALISHTSKVMLKILQARLQQYVNHELPDVQGGFRKGREVPEIKLPTSIGSSKNKSCRKTSTSALLTTPKPLIVWITTNWEKSLKRWESLTTWPACWEIHMQVRKQQLELEIEQQTGSKLGKECIKVVYCHSAYLIYMQTISCEMLACMKHKLQDCWEKYQQLQICRWHYLMAESEEELKKLLMKVKEENQNVALKLNIEKN